MNAGATALLPNGSLHTARYDGLKTICGRSLSGAAEIDARAECLRCGVARTSFGYTARVVRWHAEQKRKGCA